MIKKQGVSEFCRGHAWRAALKSATLKEANYHLLETSSSLQKSHTPFRGSQILEWFPEGLFWRMFPGSPRTERGYKKRNDGTRNRNEGTNAKRNDGTKNQNEGTKDQNHPLQNRFPGKRKTYTGTNPPLFSKKAMQWGKKWPVQMNLPFFAVEAYVPGWVQNQAEKNAKKMPSGGNPAGTGT